VISYDFDFLVSIHKPIRKKCMEEANKVKLPLQQAAEALNAVRRRGFRQPAHRRW
jgi:hypothetical protein